MSDLVALSERYKELLKSQRTATTPVEKVAIKLKMLEIEMQMRWSATDFYMS